MILRALALLMIFLIGAYCWARVFSPAFRRKYRIWWMSLAGSDNDPLDRLASLAGAAAATAIFIYIAGLGYWWK